MATSKPLLKSYRAKRDFTKTAEPSGHTRKRTPRGPVFVIHKHAASHLHYDLRLEVDGVLASWAVPKGPPTAPSIKHLAILTEDHPLDYATFEGVIPPGNYGAGTVMIWDAGTYNNIKMKDGKPIPMKQCVKNGRIEIQLNGTKLKGGYALIKTAAPDKKYWLLIKMNDMQANKKIPTSIKERSVKTGRSMNEIADARES